MFLTTKLIVSTRKGNINRLTSCKRIYKTYISCKVLRHSIYRACNHKFSANRHHSTHNHDKHYSPNDGVEGQKVTIQGIVVNIGLGFGKAIVGYLGNSSALIADAIHSFSDLVTDVVTLWTHKMARKPWSHEHPYGFGKFETIGAMAVSIVLIMSGVGIAWHSMEHMFMSEAVPTTAALIAAAISLIVKEILYHMTIRVAKKERSDLLVANAWHHRSDAISSLVAFVGIGGAILGFPALDPVAGVLVAGLIINQGYSIFLSSAQELTDNQNIERDIIEKIATLLESFPDIKGHHNLRSRKMGPYSLVDLHITVDPTLSVTSGHQIAERARIAILSQFPTVREALIHVEGAVVDTTTTTDRTLTSETKNFYDDHKILTPHAVVVSDIKKIISTIPIIKESDFFAVHYLGSRVHVIFAIFVNADTSVKEAQEIARKTREKILHKLPYLAEVEIKLELTKEGNKR